MKKIVLSALLALVPASSFASIYTAYPQVQFASEHGSFMVPVNTVCHSESDDTLKATVCIKPTANGCDENSVISTPRNQTPLCGEADIVQIFADGTHHPIGVSHYQIPACR